MKNKNVTVLLTEDEDGLKFGLCAFEDKSAITREIVSKHVQEHLGPYKNENEKSDYEELIEAICNGQSIQLYGNYFFLKEIPFYTSQN